MICAWVSHGETAFLWLSDLPGAIKLVKLSKYFCSHGYLLHYDTMHSAATAACRGHLLCSASTYGMWCLLYHHAIATDTRGETVWYLNSQTVEEQLRPAWQVRPECHKLQPLAEIDNCSPTHCTYTVEHAQPSCSKHKKGLSYDYVFCGVEYKAQISVLFVMVCSNSCAVEGEQSTASILSFRCVSEACID